LLHPLADTLLAERTGGVGDRLLILFSAGASLAIETLLQAACALGQALLLAGETAHTIAVVLAEPACIGLELPLGIGELTRFHLQIAACAARLVWCRRPQLPFDFPQAIERALTSRTRLRRILATQIAGRTAHLVGRCPHLAALSL
jgi:hypothetical protein